ncbi:MAG TPA: RNA polymerase sigma factor [Frankiaceae bacterium]|nr:RNA polymerase sigma factor [Frankiaceae bacterium]
MGEHDVRPARAGSVAARAAAFDVLYQREFPNIAGYCFLLVRDEELARDLTQEAFARLLARWVTVREPRPFLFHVVTNLARDAWRKDRRARETGTALAAQPAAPAAAHDGGVRDAVARLPEPHRTAVELYYYADLAVADVAAAVRRPPGTVKRLLSEARAMLATALGDPDA